MTCKAELVKELVAAAVEYGKAREAGREARIAGEGVLPWREQLAFQDAHDCLHMAAWRLYCDAMGNAPEPVAVEG